MIVTDDNIESIPEWSEIVADQSDLDIDIPEPIPEWSEAVIELLKLGIDDLESKQEWFKITAKRCGEKYQCIVDDMYEYLTVFPDFFSECCPDEYDSESSADRVNENRLKKIISGKVKATSYEIVALSLTYDVNYYKRHNFKNRKKSDIAKQIINGELASVMFTPDFDENREINQEFAGIKKYIDEYNHVLELEYGFTIAGICISVNGEYVQDSWSTPYYPYLLEKGSCICKITNDEYLKIHVDIHLPDNVREIEGDTTFLSPAHFNIGIKEQPPDSDFTAYFMVEKLDGSECLIPIDALKAREESRLNLIDEWEEHRQKLLREWEESRERAMKIQREQSLQFVSMAMRPLADKEEP